MKVIKVIVDEIPDSCNACDYEGNVECFRRMAFEEYINYDTTRPDWCPLVTTEQALRDCASPFASWGEG